MHRSSKILFIRLGILGCLGTTLGAGPAMDDPFARPEPRMVVSAVAPAGPLDVLELTGVSVIGGQAMVSLTDRVTRRSRWLTVGSPVEGMVAAEFDAKRDAVLVVAGESRRWIEMRKVAVQVLVLPTRTDGSIDWMHINMTDKQKAGEAEAMMTDILEVGRLARAGKLGAQP